MNALIIRHDIPGAPFYIGATVKVVAVADDTLDSDLIGATGKVVSYEYMCGCGQHFPESPMIGVELSNGSTEEFWPEELDIH
jgi:hypothetical protein